MPFSTFDLHPLLQKQAALQGYTELTAIQRDAIPAVLAGRDLMGLAPTGTGKTAAFVLPMLNRLLKSDSRRLRGLVLVPTRELAEQVNDVVKNLGAKTQLRSATVYGGVSFGKQVSNLRRGVDLIVACPGRLLDHIRQKTINLSALEILVLDEADQMFDMGFLPSIRQIMRELPKAKQSLMFSATMPDNIRSLANEMLVSPETVQVARIAPVESVSQTLLPIGSGQKTDLLLHLLKDIPREESVLVFTKTKHKAKKLGIVLKESGFRATSLQGNLTQSRRQQAMSGFRDGNFQVMVATDIAARGIDVSQVFHVVNYDMPDTVEAYTHRIGRTGRASRTGAAYTFVTHEDLSDVRATERTLKVTIPRNRLEGFAYNGEEMVFHEKEARGNFQPRSDSRGRNQGNRGPGGYRGNGNGGRNRPPRRRGGASFGSRSPSTSSTSNWQ